MKLNVVSEKAPTFNDSVGISKERAVELSKKMDVMMKNIEKDGAVFVRTCHVMEEIVSYCDNVEEVVYCIITHCNWAVQTRGIIYNPTNKN